MNLTKAETQKLLDRVLASGKYRAAGLNPETVLDLIRQEAPRQPSEKALYKIVRRKLHNIIAPYLGEPDYPALTARLDALADASPESPELRALCQDVLKEHASTAERLPDLAAFYKSLFDRVGKPNSILDLACGLHPVAFPWMGLPPATSYHAYDIVQPRLDFLNHLFEKMGLAPLAENRDVLVHPPEIEADLAVFFKEAHRFEKRRPGCNRAFWASLRVKTLIVSLPTHNLADTHSLLDQHRALVYANIPENYKVEELLFKNEALFLVHTEER